MKQLLIVLNHFAIKNYLIAKGVIGSHLSEISEVTSAKACELVKIYEQDRDGFKLLGASGDFYFYGAVFNGDAKIWETTKEPEFMEALRQFSI